ncbi:MAG TPA: hypothetical protein VFR60_04675 [Sphingomicrobium sp.]|nr:hypothetical protein [Sphingomicrobium sp.]
MLDYWLSIRGDKEFPPLHDLDPLEISDAGPNSILLELIGGGQDAEIRFHGDALKAGADVQRVIDAPNPSVLASIARKLPIVSISREFLAFEDSFDTATGMTRCWVTLLPLSSCGSWVDYVYAFVTVEATGGKSAPQPEPTEVADPAPEEEAIAEEQAVPDLVVDDEPEAVAVEAVVDEGVPVVPEDEPTKATDTVPSVTDDLAQSPEEEPLELAEAVKDNGSDQAPEPDVADETPAAKSGPGFSKLLDGIANLTGFYGQGVNVDSSVPTLDLTEAELPADEALDAGQDEEVSESASAGLPDAEAEPVAEEAPLEPDEAVEAVELQAEDTVSVEQPDDEPAQESAPAIEPLSEPQTASALEGPLQNQLAQVRAKAEEARQAQLRVTQALHESLSAAYDFALDAEGSPEEYLRLVEAEGQKIQLRAPMAPVARMAFDDVCDAATIRQFEAVLAWALKVELPRGALLERIDQAGGIPELLNEFSRAA